MHSHILRWKESRIARLLATIDVRSFHRERRPFARAQQAYTVRLIGACDVRHISAADCLGLQGRQRLDGADAVRTLFTKIVFYRALG